MVNSVPVVTRIAQLLHTQIGDNDSDSGGHGDYNDHKYRAVNIYIRGC